MIDVKANASDICDKSSQCPKCSRIIKPMYSKGRHRSNSFSYGDVTYVITNHYWCAVCRHNFEVETELED